MLDLLNIPFINLISLAFMKLQDLNYIELNIYL